MAARKTKKKTTKKTAKRGRGRPVIGKEKQRTGVLVRMEDEQRDAIEEYLEELNAKREAKGLKPLPISTWMREIALKHSGNSELGAAGKAARAAKAGSVL